MNKITVKVTKEHLDAAVEEMLSAFGISVQTALWTMLSGTCLIAQAIKGIFPKNKVAVSYMSAKVGRKFFSLSKNAIRLIARFDTSFDGDYKRDKARQARLRHDLPTTFTMSEANRGVRNS